MLPGTVKGRLVAPSPIRLHRPLCPEERVAAIRATDFVQQVIRATGDYYRIRFCACPGPCARGPDLRDKFGGRV